MTYHRVRTQGNRMLVSIARFGCCWLIAACLWALPGVVTVSHATPLVRIAAWHWIADAPTKVAVGAGLFEAGTSATSPETIAVEYVDYGVEAMQALAEGRVAFALAAAQPVARAMWLQTATHEPDFVVLASLAVVPRAHQLIADRDRGVRGPADLAGRRIGMQRYSSAHYAWAQFAQLEGIAGDAVEFVPIGLSEQVDALTSGRVDAVISWEPGSARLLRELGERAYVLPTHETYAATWLLLGRRDVVEHNPALADRVLRAYAQAIQLIRKQPTRARALHARVLGVEEKDLAPMEAGVIWHLQLGWAVLAGLDGALDWLATMPEFADRPRPYLPDYIEAGPLQRVLPNGLALPPYLYRKPSP